MVIQLTYVHCNSHLKYLLKQKSYYTSSGMLVHLHHHTQSMKQKTTSQQLSIGRPPQLLHFLPYKALQLPIHVFIREFNGYYNSFLAIPEQSGETSSPTGLLNISSNNVGFRSELAYFPDGNCIDRMLKLDGQLHRSLIHLDSDLHFRHAFYIVNRESSLTLTSKISRRFNRPSYF